MTPNRHVAALAPYALADPAPGLAPLAQNESFLPPSPKAVEAARRAVNAAHLYPDPDWTDLRAAISETHGLAAETILCGAGSMELIGALASAYLEPGDRTLTPQYAYAFFATAARRAGALVALAPESGFTVDPQALLAAVRPETRMLFLANPGNPTGTRLSGAMVRTLREALPPSVFLILDEAYGEFADAPGEACFDLVTRGDTAVLRTFSKAYALAGMRVGWGVFPSDVAAQMRKVLNPNNIAVPAQAAAAAAMRDRDHMQGIVTATTSLRDPFAERLRGLGLTVPDSRTNFVLVRLADPEAASRADAALRIAGILVRGMGGYGLPDCLRITIGEADTMMDAAAILEEALA